MAAPAQNVGKIPDQVWLQQQKGFTEHIQNTLGEAQFHKATFIVRPHTMDDEKHHPYAWNPLAYSHADAIATQWEKTTTDGQKHMINENQELLNDWRSKEFRTDGQDALPEFHFFGEAFKVVQRFDESADGHECAIVGQNDKHIVVAKKFRTLWFVAMANVVKTKKETGHINARLAYNKLCTTVLDDLDEDL